MNQRLIYQGRQLKLHTRATCLLNLLKSAQARQSHWEGLLYDYRGAKLDSTIRLQYNHENEFLIVIARMNEVQKRILKSYHRLIIELYTLTEDFLLPVNLMSF